MTSHIKVVVAIAVVASFGLGACSSQPAISETSALATPATTAPAPVASSSTDLLAGRVLPLSAYRDTPESAFALGRATAIVKNNCLAGFGVPPLKVPTAATGTPPMYRVFGITDPVIAAKYGYHVDPVGLANDAPANPMPTYSDATRLVLLNIAPGSEVPNPQSPDPPPTHTYRGKVVPPFGCQGEAAKAVTLSGVTSDEARLAETLAGESWVRSTRDRRMTEATRRFEACMTAKGFKGGYSDALGPIEDFAVDTALTQKEIATAVADVDCKRETKLIDIWFAVDKEYEDAAIQKHIETLTKVNAARDAAVANALKIAGDGG